MPVWRPFRDHSVSPWRMIKQRGAGAIVYRSGCRVWCGVVWVRSVGGFHGYVMCPDKLLSLTWFGLKLPRLMSTVVASRYVRQPVFLEPVFLVEGTML